MSEPTKKRLTEYSASAGCAAKLPPAELAQILKVVDVPRNAQLLIGPEKFSDAGIYSIRPGLGIVLTVDFFPPVVDDPEMYGAIAAANALSDCYAMGGTPLAVLCVSGFPVDLERETIEAIFRGGFEKVREAGAVVAGGHTIRHGEPLFGFSVTGEVDTNKMITNEKARAGDILYLTKPLGCGSITTGIKRGKTKPEWAAAGMRSMATLNANAAAAALEAGALTATDVTGFGLVGHSRNIARASNVSMSIDTQQLPFLPGAVELARDGVSSGGSGRNRNAFLEDVEIGAGIPMEIQNLVFDAETSGGLLICIPEAKAAALERALAKRGVEGRRIGGVLARTGKSVLLR